MRPAALVYLRDNDAAQRLVVAWPLVCKRDIRVDQAHWSKMADVPLWRVEALHQLLVEHGICNFDGTIDPLAERFIASQVAAAIKAAQRGA